MKNKQHRKDEVRWAQKHVDVLFFVLCFEDISTVDLGQMSVL